MPLLLFFTLITFADDIPNIPSSWLNEFPFSVGLLIVIVLILYWFIKSTEKRFEKRDDENKIYNESREEKIKLHNEQREKILLQQMEQLARLIDRMSNDMRDTNLKLDRNYQDSITKFLEVVKEQNERNDYSIGILTRLETKVEEIAKKSHLSKEDFGNFKNEITSILTKMGLEYNLTKKG